MKYYLPDPSGFPSQLDKPGCVGDLEQPIVDNFPVEVDLKSGGTGTLLDLREWLTEQFGPSPQDTMVEPEQFRPFACTVETDARWCYYRDRKFRFKSPDDAVVFKLTWGGK